MLRFINLTTRNLTQTRRTKIKNNEQKKNNIIKLNDVKEEKIMILLEVLNENR